MGNFREARKVLKTIFPDVPVVLELAVLETVIYTSERSHFCFSEARLKKILEDTENIAALPVGRSTKSFLIGAKIIPQMSFGAHITKIPQQVLKKIQNAVAKALWTGQPMWRSKQLLHIILSKPHRTDPLIAGAFNTVLEVVRLCHTSPNAISKLQNTWTHSTGNHSLVSSLKTAFDLLGIEYDSDINISFFNSSPVCLFDLSPKCVNRPLQNIARHACYCSIDPKSRKDLHKPSGIFDFQQSTRLLHTRHPKYQLEPNQVRRLENVLVGCTLTNDRLAASGWVTSAACRFCDQEKECLDHLLQCPKVWELLGSPSFMTLAAISPCSATFCARILLQSADFNAPVLNPLIWPQTSLHNTMRNYGQMVLSSSQRTFGSQMLHSPSSTSPSRYDTKGWFNIGTCPHMPQNFGQFWSLVQRPTSR